uniref:NADH dehydrogenase subunit 3 n=1 Tax=Desmaulus extinctorium TaxID=211681 RepID=UPI002551FB31|nr:NADH dehydrogenase subunit 3 [Desmaulus extinctorium]WGH72840.1 NADH dehydrogenase subunit 3 [Desmaulus extinctorium]
MIVSYIGGIVSVILSVVVMSLGWFLAKRTFSDREKSSPFECGFDPISSARLPFSLRFFLLAIIFLVFDVEIVLLFPVLSVLMVSFSLSLVLGAVLFLFVLILGLFHEWQEGSLDWANN